MSDIRVTKQTDTDEGWLFTVSVDGDTFEVEVDEAYWRQLTNGEIDPPLLLQQSFNFLLEREPKESILKRFKLQTIQQYFPEYEKTISQ